MEINQNYLNRINFKGNLIDTASSVAKPSDAQKPQITSLSSNPIAQAQIGLKTPISYTKISETFIPETEKYMNLYKLANGQKVAILPKEGPTIVKTYFNVGSMNEPDNLRGISHYIEHNLFNGTDKIGPGEFFHKVADMGAYTNAATGYNTTNYYIKSQLLNNETLGEIIKLHADQVQNPKFAPDQLIKEKGPVTSEITMYSDNAYNTTQNIALKNLFQINSTSEDMVAGSIKNINSLTREDVVNYYNTWYTPDNAITVITGDVDPEKTMELVAKNFNKQNPVEPMKRIHEELTPIQSTKRVDIKKANAIKTSMVMGFAGPPSNDTKAQLTLKVLDYILTNNMNSRLTKALDKEQLWAFLNTEKIGNNPSDPTGIFFVMDAPEEKSEKGLKIIYNELQNLQTNPPTEDEIKNAVNKIKLNRSSCFEKSSYINDYIGESLLDNNTTQLSNYKEILDSIDTSDIQNFIKNYLDLNKTSISVVHPAATTNEQLKSNYKNANSQNVSFKGSITGSSPANIYKDVKEYTLLNNTTVSFLPKKDGLAKSTITFATPNELNLSNPEINMLNSLLNKGTASKDISAFTNILDDKSSDISFVVGSDGILVMTSCPTEDLQTILNLSHEVLNHPRFTQEEFEKAKQEQLDNLKNQYKSPSDKAGRIMFPNKRIYQSTEKNIEELEKMTLNDLVNVYNKMILNASAHATLTAPTDENPNIFTEYMNNLYANIKPLKPIDYNIEKTYTQNSKPQIVTDTEENAQADVLQTYKYKNNRNIEDEAKLKVLNTILGGGASSRLFTDLRESQKLAYHVSSFNDNIGDTGTINLNIQTTTDDPNDPTASPENVKKALAGFDKHINELKTKQVTEAELQKAKLMLKNDILNDLETSSSKYANLASTCLTPYGKNYTEKLFNAIGNVTIKDIQNTANYIFKDAPVTSIVASKKTIESLNLNKTAD
ncbi:MAG: pitrilysin family protein [Candidatus Gastranaerophilales bacterium]|nr:pitrilysin family protein [Candidatus Gastranaerophilales bacterium]